MFRDGASRAQRPLYLLGYICDWPYFLIVVWTQRHSPTCLHHQALRLGDLLLELRFVSRSSETSGTSGTSGTSQSSISFRPAFPDACERAFSGAKHTDTDNQNRLLPEQLGAIQIAQADMLYWRNVEEKRVVEWEKLKQWHEHELNTALSTTRVLSM